MLPTSILLSPHTRSRLHLLTSNLSSSSLRPVSIAQPPLPPGIRCFRNNSSRNCLHGALRPELSLLYATRDDGEAVLPNFALLAHGAMKYCHASGIRCVPLVTELCEVFRSIAACFICFPPLLLCFVLFQIGGALPGEFLLISSARRERQRLGNFLYRDPCASFTAAESLF